MVKKSTDLTEEQEQIINDVQEKAFTPLCGHVNKQHTGVNGKLEDLACTLPKGHAGDHQAEYECLRPFDGSYEQALLPKVTMSKSIINGAVVLKEYVKVKEVAFWSDGASTPARDVKPDLEQLAQIKRTRTGVDGKVYAETHGGK